MMTREEEILKESIRWYVNVHHEYNPSSAFCRGAEWADAHQPSPWITDRMPEIKGSTSDAVLLLIDRMFYKVSRLERRKDGTEFWWGVHPEDGDEVDAWMPIPKSPTTK